MKILTMCQDIKKGGFYERYLSLINAMLKRGWKIHYISTERFPIKNRGLYFHKVSRPRKIGLPLFASFLPQAILKATMLAKKEKFDRIVIFGSLYGVIGRFVKKIHGTPMIIFLRADLIENLRIQGKKTITKPVSVAQRLAFGAADMIVVNISDVGKKVHQRFGIPKENIQ